MNPSKQITRQLVQTSKVASSALEQADTIATAMEKALGSYAQDGEPPIAWAQLQKLVGRRLMSSSDTLRQADDRLSAAGTSGTQLRQQRRAAVSLLRQELRRVRFLFDETLPKLDSQELFPQRGRLSSLDPARLARLGRQIVELLQKESTQARLQAETGNLPQVGALAGTVEAATLQLEGVLQDLEPELRNEERSFDQRQQGRQETLESWRRSREFLRGIYRVAGFDYLAEQLLVRRPKKAAENEAPEQAPPPPASMLQDAAPSESIGFRI